ncbi:substrate-binding periplasmic protein [Colwellia piezophila]|uniref:substrate-binding periplasmic protein n=1 Tax=Colwellia piezophila TaxID=211668 RepID=UPI000380EFE6|nr:transporter substrate-binding domain-containing protein [Colwellia piezophila]
MVKILSHFLLLLLLLSPNLLMAKQQLTVGVGNFPPFFVEKDEKGFFLEITKAIFKQLSEYNVNFIYMSNHRLLHEINSGKIIDVACNIFADSQVDGFLSLPLYQYTDVAVSNKSAKLSINKIADLQGFSITAYQGAKDLLGEEFKKMALANPKYSEHSQPKDSTYLMVTGQKDIRIGDLHIFLHDIANSRYKNDMNITAENFTIHELWPDVYSHMAFKDEKLRDSVNVIINELTENGTLDAIYAKYR